MPGVELSTGAWDGHVVVALRAELDVTGAAGVEAALAALMLPGAVRLARPAVSTARPWEGSAVEYRYRIIGAGSPTVPAEGRAPGPAGSCRVRAAAGSPGG
jgi:hypothetical protein